MNRANALLCIELWSDRALLKLISAVVFIALFLAFYSYFY